MKLDIIPTAGILFPGPEPLRLRGRRYRALELKVRHVGRLERAARRMVDHPFRGMDADFAALDAVPAGSADRWPILDKFWDASDCWPPRFGSAPYWRAMASVGVGPTFLRLVLRRTRPALTPAGGRALAAAMTAAEWRAVDRVAHGTWPSAGDGTGRGMDWRGAVRFLTDPRGGGMARAAVGDLYLSQLFFRAAGPDASYSVELPDRPDTPTA